MRPEGVFDVKELEDTAAGPTAEAPEADREAVIVELDNSGRARVREAPSGVVVMIVESVEVPERTKDPPASGKRSIGAGGRSGARSTAYEGRPDIEVRNLSVYFPG